MMQDKRILVIEDDANIRRLLSLTLKSEGYKVDCAETGKAGRMLLKSNSPDLVLLDLGLPDCDGIDLLRRFNDEEDVLVIVITARDNVDQKVAALDAGANDYVVKPFSTDELFARIRAVMRYQSRNFESHSKTYVSGGLEVNFETYTIHVDGEEVHLTPNECKLLKILIENRGKALTHRAIHREVWGAPTTDEYRTLRVLVTSLRRKLNDKPSCPKYIRTEVGVGYRFVGD